MHFVQEREVAIERCSFNQNPWELSVKKLIRTVKLQDANLQVYEKTFSHKLLHVFCLRITITSCEEALKLCEYSIFQETWMEGRVACILPI